MNKDKLKKVLKTLTSADDMTLAGFQSFDQGISDLKEQLRERIVVSTLDEVNTELNRFRKNIDLSPLVEAFSGLQADLGKVETSLATRIDNQVQEVVKSLVSANQESSTKISELLSQLEQLQAEVGTANQTQTGAIGSLKLGSQALDDRLQALNTLITTSTTGTKGELLTELKASQKKLTQEITALQTTVNQKIEQLNTTIMSRLANLGGGSMDRQILVNGSDALTRYTDINFVGDIDVSNNDTSRHAVFTFQGGNDSLLVYALMGG